VLTLVCRYCHELYESKYSKRKYCSRMCSNRAKEDTPPERPTALRCRKCREEKPLEDFPVGGPTAAYGRRRDCKACFAAAWREKYSTDATFREQRKRRWKETRLARWGLTPEDFEDARCAICGTNQGDALGRRLHVDHDHESGAFRGILCTSCNSALGKFRDSPALLATAASYLIRTGGEVVSR
jgi:hypothetical protein